MSVVRFARKPTRVDFANRLRGECQHEIERTFPEESGGVLMGQWLSRAHVRIDEILGPGPNASHERFSFRPDLEWQHRQIAAIHARTGGRTTYVGDWHSHPYADSGRLSRKDEGVLAQIMHTPAAQCPEPLMAIFWGCPQGWNMSVWQGRPRWRRLPWGSVRVSACDCRS